ncbi:MAG TPA: hypothetical protein VHP58_02050 [Alphaproteobacteria bacterium]|nr:hypothetical protein [Alphaproteobacteria bacterium]
MNPFESFQLAFVRASWESLMLPFNLMLLMGGNMNLFTPNPEQMPWRQPMW